MADTARRERKVRIPPRPVKQAAEAIKRTSTERTRSRETVEEVEVVERVGDVQQFVTEPAYVRVATGVTKNLGNYESLRIDVSITKPCYVEDIETTFHATSDDVANYLQAEMDKYGC